jgi:hypothetical protein
MVVSEALGLVVLPGLATSSKMSFATAWVHLLLLLPAARAKQRPGLHSIHQADPCISTHAMPLTRLPLQPSTQRVLLPAPADPTTKHFKP